MSSFFSIVKSKVSILTIIQAKIKLKKYGKDYIGLCPFHTEKTPSFRVNNVKNFFYCFGCSTGGDVISFIAKIHNIQYKVAALKLAKEHNIQIPTFNQSEFALNSNKKNISAFLEKINDHFVNNLFMQNYNSQFALQYLLNRNINLEEIKNYQFGLANTKLQNIFFDHLKDLAQSGLIAKSESGEIYEVFRNRLIIPIKNQHNNLIAFGGRSLDEKMPKYLNSPEILIFKKNEALYGENIAFNYAYKDNYILLVEGYFDCITLQINGYLNSVASLGTAVTLEHLNKIWSCVEEIIICMDSDTAGIKATKRIINIAIEKISCINLLSFIYLPVGYDPDSFIREKGKKAFDELLQKKETLSQIIWRFEIKDNIINSAEDFAKLSLRIENICNKISDPIIKKTFTSFFKTKVWELHKLKFLKYGKNLTNANIDNTSFLSRQNNLYQKLSQNKFQATSQSNATNYPNKVNNFNNINSGIGDLSENDIIEFTILAQLLYLLKLMLETQNSIQKLEILIKNNNHAFDAKANIEELNKEIESNFFIYYQTYFAEMIFKNQNIATLQLEFKNNVNISDKLSFLLKFNSSMNEYFTKDAKLIFNKVTQLRNITYLINLNENILILNVVHDTINQQDVIEQEKLQIEQNKIQNILNDLKILKLKHQLIKLKNKYNELTNEKTQDIELILIYIKKIQEKEMQIKAKINKF